MNVSVTGALGPRSGFDRSVQSHGLETHVLRLWVEAAAARYSVVCDLGCHLPRSRFLLLSLQVLQFTEKKKKVFLGT